MAEFKGIILQHIHDTDEEWAKVETKFVPAAGELVIYEADSEHPVTRIKIGTGRHTLAALPFVDEDIRKLLNLYQSGTTVPTKLEKGQIYFRYE